MGTFTRGKTSFGTTPESTTPTAEDTNKSIGTFRTEAGAIWKSLTKNNFTIYNVRINLSKAKLQELLAAANGEEVNISLVGFDNKGHGGNNARPIIRVYEDKPKS